MTQGRSEATLLRKPRKGDMRRHAVPRLSRRQGGWVGMLAVLLALVIVALLAKDALKEYGLRGGTGGPGGPAGVPAKGGRAMTPGETPNPVDAAAASGTPFTAIDRARAVDGTLQQQADERARRLDDAAR